MAGAVLTGKYRNVFKECGYSEDEIAKRVEQTSPDTLDETEKTFNIRYPTAIAPTDNIAIAESPLIWVLFPVFSRRTAHMIVTGIINRLTSAILRTVAIASAPNATCERPSPMNENLLSTSVTPRSDEHKAISTPTISAYLTNGYDI